MSAPPSVADTLNAAVAAALAAGVPCSGWMLSASADGYAAWLYVEAGDTDRSLFAVVEGHASVEDAAAWALLMAQALGAES